ncbi:hypothetical protein [Aeoliella sp. SH292]|uniref:hypothetical protein n=1 Tax=Aeoliella sp. SH292 TaxID=3454464 RepID=UPI003F98A468
MNNLLANITNKTFAYHDGVLAELCFWTDTSGLNADELKALTESTIRSCHQAAIVEELPYGRQPLIYSLGIGLIKVYYSVEEHVVVRGYCENLPTQHLHEDSLGGIYSTGTW